MSIIYLHIHIHIYAITISKKKYLEFEGGKGRVYGRLCRKEMEGKMLEFYGNLKNKIKN